ncbi:hypothetical protein CJU89_2423 [Yarrowia sp. B02]|nr:hypothetical protein CJU89_2423 [Yarrowia sp. B02]
MLEQKAGSCTEKDVGVRLCEYALTIGVPLKGGTISAESRKGMKRKAKAFIKTTQPFRGVSKKKFPDLEEATVAYFSDLPKGFPITLATASSIVKILLDKILFVVPDYRELYGMTGEIPNPKWLNACRREANFLADPSEPVVDEHDGNNQPKTQRLLESLAAKELSAILPFGCFGLIRNAEARRVHLKDEEKAKKRAAKRLQNKTAYYTRRAEVGSLLCDYAISIDVSLPGENNDASSRAEVKRKAKNHIKSQKRDRGFSKKRYADLEDAVVNVLSNTPKHYLRNTKIVTAVVQIVLDRILAIVPDFREIYGMKRRLPNPLWIRDCAYKAGFDGDILGENPASREHTGTSQSDDVGVTKVMEFLSSIDIDKLLPGGTEGIIRNAQARRDHLKDDKKTKEREANRL